jgi:hypothetical protein
VSRAQLKLHLVGSTSKFGRGFSVEQSTAVKPFVALFDVVGVGIDDGTLRNRLFRALRAHNRNRTAVAENEQQQSQPTTKTAA